MRLIKKWLSGALCLVLLLGLLPTAALAEGETADWADPAVTVLKEIYGSDIFSTSDEAMDTRDARKVLDSMGRSDLTAPNPFNRGTACEVLADVFTLPVGVGENAAITYLYQQNIVNGKSEDNLGAEEPVSFAEFAVLTYRVLNFVGGGKGTGVAGLKPGTPEYMAWMYLAVRKCVPFVVGEDKTPIDINQTIGTATGIETYVSSALKPGYADIYDVSTAPKSGKEIWDAWEAALGDTNIGGIKDFSATGYDEDDTLVAAATKMVGQFMAQKGEEKDIIFHDVAPDNWFYDGIMYLANQNIVIGYGDGQFGPDDITPRFQFAVLLSVMDGTVSSTDTNPARISTAIDHVRKAGYLDIPESANDENPFTDSYWSQTTTREEAVVGILRMIEETENIITTSNNLAILDRFTDKDQIANEASKPYLAYAVSVGLLSGTSENTLSPKDPVSRAQTGVLLYRTLIGLDYTKMKDYRDSVDYAQTDSPAQTFALFAADPAPTPAQQEKTLILREDWRLTDELDLVVPGGTTLTSDGKGKYHIYEMGGTLQNSGPGKVVFVKDTETTKGTILYPQGSSETCTPETSDALMERRQPHKVTVDPSTNGTVTVDKLAAEAGETVTLAATANQGYEFSAWSVKDVYGNAISVSDNTFTMPASSVSIQAAFRKIVEEVTPPFTDVREEDYYYDAVLWAVENGVTNGTGEDTFSPDTEVSRAQMVTFLWRAHGTPKATGSNPFADVSESDYYYDAVLWAVESGVTTGTGRDTFAPDAPVGRAQAVTFQWRAAGSPATSGSGFDDVAGDAWYTDAVSWAVSEEITNGTGSNRFSPDAVVSRAQAVTFLYREQA